MKSLEELKEEIKKEKDFREEIAESFIEKLEFHIKEILKRDKTKEVFTLTHFHGAYFPWKSELSYDYLRRYDNTTKNKIKNKLTESGYELSELRQAYQEIVITPIKNQ